MAPYAEQTTSQADNGLVGDGALALVQGLRPLPWEHIRQLTLSLKGIGRIDASGVVALVRLFSQLTATGRRLRLCHVGPEIRAELDRLDLTSALEIIEDAAPDAGLCVALTDLAVCPVQPHEERFAA